MMRLALLGVGLAALPAAAQEKIHKPVRSWWPSSTCRR